MRDLYEIMGLQRDATDEQIQKAYRKLAFTYHPDRNPGDDSATEKFKEVQSAYEVLGDPEKRAAYDRFGQTDGQPNPFRGSPFKKGKPFTSVFDDFFSNFMGEQRRAQTKGEDIHVEVEVTLDEVLKGAEREIKCRRHKLCPKCNGLGGNEAECQHCMGAGVRIIHGKNATVQIACQGCGGSGRAIVDNCPDCEGGLLPDEEETLQFTVQPGVEDGMTFIRKGKGEPAGAADGSPGDLFIHVKTKPHTFFQRLKNGYILLNLPVTYSELALGAEIEVPTLESRAKLKIPAGTQTDTKFRLKGLGLPIFNNSSTIYQRGDQLVQVKLEVPKNPEGRYREVLEELAEIEKTNVTPLRREYLDKLGDQNGRSQE